MVVGRVDSKHIKMPQASAAACGVPASPVSGVSGAGAECARNVGPLTWAIPIMASLVAVVAMASEHRVPSGEAFGGDGIGKDRCHFRRASDFPGQLYYRALQRELCGLE